MVDFNSLLNSYSLEQRKPQFRQSILKEFFQYKILDIIYNSKWSGNLVFLGGTSLRIIHDFRRFSDDIDFDITGIYTENDHDELCNYICKRLTGDGIHVELDRNKKTNRSKGSAYTRYISFPQMLKNQGIHNDPRKKFFVKLDAQRHNYGDFVYTPEERIINKFGIFTAVKVTPIDIILAMKYCSALERVKGRDFYDITELVNITVPNHDYLVNRFRFGSLCEEYYGPVHLKEKLIEKLSAIKEKEWKEKAGEIERYIFNPAEVSKVLLFNKWILDRSFLRFFGLEVTGDNKVIDPSATKIKRFRLNKHNLSISIPIYPGSEYFTVTPKPDKINLFFTNTTGNKTGANLSEFPEKIFPLKGYNNMEFIINPENLTPVSIEICFY